MARTFATGYSKIILLAAVTAVPLLTDARTSISPCGLAFAAAADSSDEQARQRCQQADAFIAQGKYKEAAGALEPLLKDAGVAKSPYRKTVAYYHGWACFSMGDLVAAGRSLSTLAPFDDPVLSLRARYLLGRIHQLADERPEAVAHYEAVVAGYPNGKRAAQDGLKNADALNDRPDQKARLEELAGDAPDYVGLCGFYLGTLMQEQARYGDALAKFVAFAQQNPKSPQASEAILRQGICRVELKQFRDAVRTLSPLKDDPQVADQALWYLGRAQVGSIDSGDNRSPQASAAAIDNLRAAAEKAQEIGNVNPAAKSRRGEILLDLAENQQLAKQYTEAAQTCRTILAENNTGPKEAALYRLAMVLHQGRQYPESDEVCQKFAATYPRSSMVPSILFRSAENAFLSAASPGGSNSVQGEDTRKLLRESIRRYQVVIDRFPEFQQINLARQGQANAHYLMGEFTQAADVLGTIPPSECVNELASVPFLQADCLLRTLPQDAEDALTTARLLEQVERAQKLLNVFLSAQENSAQAPEALIKLGYCYQRTAVIVADPDDRRAALKAARDAYHRLARRYPNHTLFAKALLENSRVLAEMGDVGTALNQLSRFQTEPLSNSDAAPAALIQMSEYLRQQKRAADAVKALEGLGKQRNAELSATAPPEWAAQFQYNYGLSLKEAGRFAEARNAFETVSRQFRTRPEAADATWQLGLARRDEAASKARAALEQAAKSANAQELAAADSALKDAGTELLDAARYLESQASAAVGNSAQPRIRMLLAAASCYRTLADVEFAGAKRKVEQEKLARMQARIAQDYPKNAAAPKLRIPEVAVAALPVQPSEQRARDQYKAVIETAADSPLSVEGRLALAELLGLRNEYDAAIKIISDALDQDLPVDTLEKLRIRIGKLYLAKGDGKSAQTHFEAVAQNPRSRVLSEGRCGVGESLVAQQQWKQAIDRLRLFREREDLKALPGISDRAFLLIAQAYIQTGEWEPAQQALQSLLRRFPNSAWADEARFNMGLVQQKAKQLDAAVGTFAEVAGRDGSELSARAQLQIGLCRMEQNQFSEAAEAFMAVPYAFDYPDVTASALCEAAKALVALDKKQEATQLLERVVKDNPASRWAELAMKRLAELK